MQHLPENSILFRNRPFAARFSNCSNSLNFEAKINFNNTRQNDLKWRKTCTGLKFNLEYLNGPQTKFIGNSLYKHPVERSSPSPIPLLTPWHYNKTHPKIGSSFASKDTGCWGNLTTAIQHQTELPPLFW